MADDDGGMYLEEALLLSFWGAHAGDDNRNNGRLHEVVGVAIADRRYCCAVEVAVVQ